MRLSCGMAFLFLLSAYAQAATFGLGLHEAEKQALRASDQLKSFLSEAQAADEQADAQFTGLLPKLSLQGTYTYYGTIPSVAFGPNFPAINFGTNNTYMVGPVLSYTLWDTFSARKSYHAAESLAEARSEDHRNAELQLLYSLRSAYVQVQLGIEELRLIYDSLQLARAEEQDVQHQFHAGAAARLDLLTAQRSVLSNEIQFKQRQADLSSSFKDLLTLLGDHQSRDISNPGPAGIPRVTLVLGLDPLSKTLAEMSRMPIQPPDDQQPQIRSQELQAESFELGSESQTAKMFPTLQVSGSVTLNLPDIPNPPQFWQQAIGVSLSFPLFVGDPSPHLSAQNRDEAIAAEHREAQLKENLARDYTKAVERLKSLQGQKELATRDIDQSEEAAKLYYSSYKAGRLNFIDVQNANVQALMAKVNAARIDAQILSQIFLLESISGEGSEGKTL